LRKNPCSQFVEINPAGDVVAVRVSAVPDQVIMTGWLVIVRESRDFLSEQIVNFEPDVGILWQFIFNSR